MGIPYFFYNLYKKYNKSNDFMINEKELINLNISYLFLDYNSMIHPCAQNVILKNKIDKENFDEYNKYIEDLIIKECLLYTEFIINIINPKKTHIMIDGIAPMAKIIQQRERRYKSYVFKNILKKKEDNFENESAYTWDTNKITPGTLFMKKLSKCLFEFQKKSIYKIEISDASEPGEGEHKMMKIIDKLNNDNFYNIDSNICIYGLDADLIMLSLLNKYSNKIILLRDNTFNLKYKEQDRKFTYLSIDKLKNAIINEMRNEYKYKYKTDIILTDKQLIQDYVFLCILLGNDFLHNIPSLIIKENASSILLKSYIKCIRNESLTCNNEYLYNSKLNNINIQYENIINMDLFIMILYELSCLEDYFFKNIYSIYKSNKLDIYKDEIEYELLETENIICYKDDIILYNKDGYKSRYYAYYNIIDIENSCKNYLEGVIWVWGYYNLHIHNNWTWMYSDHATPFVSDIYYYLSNNKHNFKEYIKNAESFKKSRILTSFEQLLIVLPKKSLLNIIKEFDINKYNNLQRILRCNSKVISNLFPNKIILDMIHKEYLWQSRIFFNEFDIKYLKYIT